MKVNNGLVMTQEEDNRFLYAWLLYCVSNFADSRMEVPWQGACLKHEMAK